MRYSQKGIKNSRRENRIVVKEQQYNARLYDEVSDLGATMLTIRFRITWPSRKLYDAIIAALGSVLLDEKFAVAAETALI